MQSFNCSHQSWTGKKKENTKTQQNCNTHILKKHIQKETRLSLFSKEKQTFKAIELRNCWFVDENMMNFVWAGKPLRLAKSILHLPFDWNSMALSNFLIYNWAAVLVTVGWWFAQPRDNAAVTLEAALLGS